MLFGICFLVSEYLIGKIYGGCIDLFGLDENYCFVILEYKCFIGENVIN